MQRNTIQPRAGWQQTVEGQGLLFHSIDDRTYWDESVYYRFTPQEIGELERATAALDQMCLAAVQHVIDEDRLDAFAVPPAFRNWVRQSWERDEITIYGRFDLAYDGSAPPKLLEYNADTPTALLEAAVIQWFWLRDQFPDLDQFNSIHERLIEAWQRWRAEAGDGLVHFAAIGGSQEDFMTVTYLRETARQAGLNTEYLNVERIGWNPPGGCFVDEQERAIRTCFKLYPWEWMTRDSFAPHLTRVPTRWIEPPWKMLLSNKALLVVLWELFPDHPYLLPASFEPMAGDHVCKPTLSREGANVQIIRNGRVEHEQGGPYGGPFVYQRLADVPRFDGAHPILGSWMVNGHACGMGIREDLSPITGNTSRFVPHVIDAR